MTQMTRTLAKTIAQDIETALESVAAKHGCAVKVKGGTYSDTFLSQKVEFSVIGADGEAQTREMTDLRSNLWRFDMTVDDLDKTYSHPMIDGGKRFTVVGYKTRARKNNVIIRMENGGKLYVIPSESLRACVALAKKAA